MQPYNSLPPGSCNIYRLEKVLRHVLRKNRILNSKILYLSLVKGFEHFGTPDGRWFGRSTDIG
jgi:hypothetical protein